MQEKDYCFFDKKNNLWHHFCNLQVRFFKMDTYKNHAINGFCLDVFK